MKTDSPFWLAPLCGGPPTTYQDMVCRSQVESGIRVFLSNLAPYTCKKRGYKIVSCIVHRFVYGCKRRLLERNYYYNKTGHQRSFWLRWFQGDRLDSLKYFRSNINLKVLLDCIKCLKQGLKSHRGFVRRCNNPSPRQPATRSEHCL